MVILEVKIYINIGNRIEINTTISGKINLHAFMDSMAGEQEPGVIPDRPLNAEKRNYV